MGADYIDYTFSGAFYAPDHGYVVLLTPVPFRYYFSDIGPSSGILELEGASGTKARLTALSSTTCLIAADTDGNGTYDWSSGALSW